MIYAYAFVKAGVPLANGSPNLMVDVPAIQRMAEEADRADRRARLQDRPDA